MKIRNGQWLVRSVRLVFLALLVQACRQPAFAEVQVTPLFSDHMVMQRDVEVPVWGWAEPGEAITVAIDTREQKTTAGKDGKWMVRLPAMGTGAPRTMTITGKDNTLKIADILLGEVWIASGQSNMAWPLKQAVNGKAEVASASVPELRLFNVPNEMAPKGPRERLPAGNPKVKNMNQWQACSPDTAAEFSAVAYFFGRDLQQSLHVPVGIIANAVGGSPIEAWISHDALKSDPDFNVVADYFDGLANYVENTEVGKKDMANMVAQYDAKQADLRAQGKPMLWPEKYPGPFWWGFGSTLYNALTNPLAPYAMRGVIWYQGEAQWQWMSEYRGIFPLLIKDWRKRWGQGDFPFLFVQLASFAKAKTEPEAGGTAFLREAQLMTLKVPHTAMVVSIDVGDAESIHPLNKQDVGKRLSLAARATVYGEQIAYSGPIYQGMKIEGSAIRVSFDHAGNGMMIGKKNGLDPVVEDKESKLKHFAIAGDDMKFVWADAVIDKDTVVVSSPSVQKPVAVRYAWSSNPEGCNLYSKEGLPASPFRTDESPVIMGEFYRSALKKGFALKPTF